MYSFRLKICIMVLISVQPSGIGSSKAMWQAMCSALRKWLTEINAGADELTEWARGDGNSLFLKPDAMVAARFGEVTNWVTSQQYEPSAINTFLQVADFYLIAHALASGYIVVTHEIAANSTRRIKIPNVCIGLGLRFMTPYEMLRREHASFILGHQS
jgi:hypothetical protein